MCFVGYGGKRTKISAFRQTEEGAIIKKAMFSVIIVIGVNKIVTYFVRRTIKYMRLRAKLVKAGEKKIDNKE